MTIIMRKRRNKYFLVSIKKTYWYYVMLPLIFIGLGALNIYFFELFNSSFSIIFIYLLVYLMCLIIFYNQEIIYLNKVEKKFVFRNKTKVYKWKVVKVRIPAYGSSLKITFLNQKGKRFTKAFESKHVNNEQLSLLKNKCQELNLPFSREKG